MTDAESAALVVAVAGSLELPPQAMMKRLTPEWAEACLVAVQGPESLDRWLGFIRIHLRSSPDRAQAIEAALGAARSGQLIAINDPDGPFDFQLIDTATFFGQTYALDFLAKGILVRDQPCVFGGPQKSLKTSILIDLAISLASGTPFLGRFSIPERCRVGLISGESGKAVIQANAKQICIARDLPFDQAAGIFWGFDPPRLSVPRHLAGLRKTIRNHGLGAILLDPLYLMLITETSAIDPKDMFQMGPLLAEAAAACLEAGATPVLCHHFVKKRDDPFGPPDMGELAYAGIGQFMRQWMLISRRERYNPETGLHAMHFNFGGSAGHSGELHLDIDTGRIDEELAGREWRVAVLSPGESRLTRDQQTKQERAMREAQKAREAEESKLATVQNNAEKLFAVMIVGNPETLKALRTKVIPVMSNDTALSAMSYLVREGRVREVQVKRATGTYTGYEVIPPDGFQGLLDM